MHRQQSSFLLQWRLDHYSSPGFKIVGRDCVTHSMEASLHVDHGKSHAGQGHKVAIMQHLMRSGTD